LWCLGLLNYFDVLNLGIFARPANTTNSKYKTINKISDPLLFLCKTWVLTLKINVDLCQSFNQSIKTTVVSVQADI